MALLKLFAAVILVPWTLPVLGADASADALAIRTPVVVVVGQFPPTQVPPADSGYSKPLVIHPGKRGIVVGLARRISEGSRDRQMGRAILAGVDRARCGGLLG